jgi:signal peptidase I
MDIAAAPGDSTVVRPIWARLGIVALNLLAPGLGLLRLGRTRSALRFFATPIAAVLVVLAFLLVAPPLGFLALALCYALVIGIQIGAILASAWLSWRHSLFLHASSRWSRWYAIVALGAFNLLLFQFLTPAWQHFYKPFYIPSGAMSPTLLTNDHILAYMRGPGELRRGDIVIFAVPDGAYYIKRVAGLAGDTIAMENGIVLLNGKPVAQSLEREEAFSGWMGTQRARRLRERFPGEPGSHEIYDQGDSVVDNFPPTRVLPGHVFVLGDNRDDSADSRVDRLNGGVEQLPVADILGRALFYTYGPSHRMGDRINPE